ncbi:MAG: 2-iminobutanoate/2-iminopropanoate deaminase [Oceanicoccus sp.]|jgi:2-iminobutanoate/2-iminopropanoate deaminase
MKSFLVVVLLGFSALTSAAELEVFGTEKTKRLNLPFSEAVAVGDLLFVSGQIGNKPGELALVEGGVQAQTRQAMTNIIEILNRYGSSVDKIAKCTIFLGDMSEWAEMNIAYLEALGDHRPARSAFGSSGLALGGSVEIECIAAR